MGGWIAYFHISILGIVLFPQYPVTLHHTHISLNLNRKMHNLWPFLLTVRVATQTLLLRSWYHRLQHKCSCFCPNWIALHGPLLLWEINLSLNTSLPLLPSPRLHNLRIHQNPAECSWHYIHLSWLVNLSDIGRLTNWHRKWHADKNIPQGNFKIDLWQKSSDIISCEKWGKHGLYILQRKILCMVCSVTPILRFGCSCRQFVPMFSLLEM